MTSLLRKVRMRTSIHAHRKVRSVLDGEYGSVHKGRSMDFDDLREYVPGDDIKDLDWKASARHGRPLIKRYIATRQHAVLLVVDTDGDMPRLDVLLEYVARNIRRRTILVVITDDIDLTERHRALLRRLDA